MILGAYSITYLDVKITQIKNLIPHTEFLRSKQLLAEEILRTGGSSKETDWNIGKNYLKPYGDYFTTQSPLFYAMFSGELHCNNQTIPVDIYRLWT